MATHPRKEIPAEGNLRREWLWALLLVLTVVATYLPAWWAGFIWDDDSLFTANPVIVGPLGLWEIWTTGAADICPFTLTTFWIEHALWGLAPLPYHLVNIAFHAGCAVFLWRVLLSLEIPGAWLGAALWALHPVQAGSVLWISEMKNTESGLFFLLAILFFIKRLKRADDDRTYVLMLVFAFLAMASKSSTVILPLVLLLCTWWIERGISWLVVKSLLPVFGMSLAAGVLSLWTQGKGTALLVNVLPHRDGFQRLADAADAVFFYLGELAWPHPLMMVYPAHASGPLAGFTYFALLLAVLITVSLVWQRSRARMFAWLYFIVALLPVLGFVDLNFFRFSFVADHFQYLASMGPLAFAAAGMITVANLIQFRQRWKLVLGALVLINIGKLSWQRGEIYQNEETLWTDTLAKNPESWLAHNNLGAALSARGEPSAVEHYQKALQLNPNYALAWNNYGKTFLDAGNFDEAASRFARAVELDPNDVTFRNNLGSVLLRQGKTDEAIVQYRKAVLLAPYDAVILNNFGLALAHAGRTSDAAAAFKEAVRLKPDYTEARDNLARARSSTP